MASLPSFSSQARTTIKPIGQTFYVSEPKGIFVTRIDVFFKTISSAQGIELQIRTTENGIPTPNRLQYGRKVIQPTDTYSASDAAAFGDITQGDTIITKSSDASSATSFIFDTPVFLAPYKLYAFTVAPIGGTPEYSVWTAVVGSQDIATGTPISDNNNTGDLFLSSNDLTWDPIINEDMKFNIYTANFTATSGNAYFNSGSVEFIAAKNVLASFIPQEKVVFSNNYYNLAYLTLTGVANGTFNTGSLVWQNTGTANVSGVIYSNTTGIYVQNTNGRFIATANNDTKINANTGAYANVSAAYQNTITASSNSVTVPFSNVYTTNQVIFISTSNKSSTDVVKITAIPDANTLRTNVAISFTATDAVIGAVQANGDLYAYHAGGTSYSSDLNYIPLTGSTANGSVNLYGKANVEMIGIDSGTSATVVGVINPIFNAVTPQFGVQQLPDTDVQLKLESFQNATNNPAIDFVTIKPNQINELIDTERVSMSRSNEYSGLPIGRKGNNSIVVQATLGSDYSSISPAVDVTQTTVMYTHNIVSQDYELNGYYLTINNNGVAFSDGDIVYQNSSPYGSNTYGTVHIGDNLFNGNSSFITVVDVNGKFVSNTAFYLAANDAAGFINTAEEYSEAYRNGYKQASRYISKTIGLAPTQDAEDIRAYCTAYRPANTDVYVYAKVKNSADSDQFKNKDWTKLQEVSSAALTSSQVNQDDFVELQYGFPQSENLFTQKISCNTTSNTVTVVSTQGLSNNQYIYLAFSNSSVSYFNVRENFLCNKCNIDCC